MNNFICVLLDLVMTRSLARAFQKHPRNVSSVHQNFIKTGAVSVSGQLLGRAGGPSPGGFGLFGKHSRLNMIVIQPWPSVLPFYHQQPVSDSQRSDHRTVDCERRCVSADAQRGRESRCSVRHQHCALLAESCRFAGSMTAGQRVGPTAPVN